MRRGRYYNRYVENIRKGIWDFFQWHRGHFREDGEFEKAPLDFCYPNPFGSCDVSKPQVAWVNHSTFYLELFGVKVLTDPIWSTRCSPSRVLGPKRYHAPPYRLENLKDITLICLSHNHYDHLDKKTILFLLKQNPEITFLVPDGVEPLLNSMGAKRVVSLKWWESKKVRFPGRPGLCFKATAVPSQHFSGRGMFDKNKTLWCGWVVEVFYEKVLEKTFYFVGDTGYNDYDFKSIGEHFNGFDLSLIPIGTYRPKLFMSPVHICPEKAVKIHQEVKSRLSIGMHWKTFRLSEEGMKQPPYDLYLEMKKASLDPLNFRVLNPGQLINW